MHQNLTKILWEVPFLPENQNLYQVKDTNIFIQAAKKVALEQTSDLAHPTGAVIVKNNQIIGEGANFSQYHKKHGCERKKLKCKSGEGYDLCVGCNPQFHAEATAIRHVLAQNKSTKNCDLYLWGHWWCCQACWQKIIDAKISRVFLSATAIEMFKK
jgi:deoxycytidylate deaminase